MTGGIPANRWTGRRNCVTFNPMNFYFGESGGAGTSAASVRENTCEKTINHFLFAVSGIQNKHQVHDI